jgi:hypothetical protein
MPEETSANIENDSALRRWGHRLIRYGPYLVITAVLVLLLVSQLAPHFLPALVFDNYEKQKRMVMLKRLEEHFGIEHLRSSDVRIRHTDRGIIATVTINSQIREAVFDVHLRIVQSL